MKRILISVLVVAAVIAVKAFLAHKNGKFEFNQDYLQGKWTYQADGITEGARLVSGGEMTVTGDRFHDKMVMKAVAADVIVFKATFVTSGSFKVTGNQLEHTVENIKILHFWSMDDEFSEADFMGMLEEESVGSSTIATFTENAYTAQENSSGIEFKYLRMDVN